MELLKPKSYPLTLDDGTVKTFILSKFPAVSGREIIAKYPLSNMPKMGDYAVSEEVMFKLMAFVGVEVDGGNVIPLSTRGLINNHAGDWLTLAKLEWAMLEYNVAFFANGGLSTFFDKWKAEAPQWITRIATDFLAQSSGTGKQPSTN